MAKPKHAAEAIVLDWDYEGDCEKSVVATQSYGCSCCSYVTRIEDSDIEDEIVAALEQHKAHVAYLERVLAAWKEGGKNGLIKFLTPPD